MIGIDDYREYQKYENKLFAMCGGPYSVGAPVRSNMLNMPKSGPGGMTHGRTCTQKVQRGALAQLHPPRRTRCTQLEINLPPSCRNFCRIPPPFGRYLSSLCPSPEMKYLV